MNSSLVVTTGIRSGIALEQQALELSRQLNVPYVRRQKRSLDNIKEMSGAQVILLVKSNKLSLVVDGKELFFIQD